jgi:methylthioribose-1-phosphate isomerase
MRAIDWITDGSRSTGFIRMVDQTKLPGATVMLDIDTVDGLIGAIQRLSVRGAPALGVAGALGVALATQNLDPEKARDESLRLREARPTAVNLSVGVDRALAAFTAGGADAALRAALELRDQDIESCLAMSARGADLVRELAGVSATGTGDVTIMTICNTGGLAAVEHGTALGVVERLHLDGDLTMAIALETRPLLQGARLTTWELGRMGASHRLIVDSAAAMTLARGGVDAVLVGADRIAHNGDTANKIGTFSLAVAAHYTGVPFIVVAPETTVDPATATGAEGTAAGNPAFDVTPAALIRAIVTERRVIRPGDAS